MDISIIIPTYRDNQALHKCLSALKKQSLSVDKFEVIVVNNDPENQLNLKSDSLNLTLVNEDKPGSYTARNKGIEEAKGEIIGFTDADCIPNEKWISTAVDLLQNEPEIDLIGGKIEQFKVDDKMTDAVFEYQRLFSFNQEHYINQKGFSVTANLFVRKKVFDKIGDFNSDLFSGGDFDFGLRAKKAGFSIVYDPNLVVNHPVRGGLKDLKNKKIRTTQGGHDMRESAVSFTHILRLLFPPFKSISKINNVSSYPVKIKVFFITWYLKLIECFESIRLSVGKKNRNRS